ncbi:SbcC/MukB-like Walker B domain-containing protein [Streptomyces goshikiensis]
MTVDVPERWLRRWHLSGAGVENVWHYTREELACRSGRLLLRGANGTGKTTLLEGLCPYLLDPRAQALSSGKNRATSLESLMKEGSEGRRRNGCLWLSFTAPRQASEAEDLGEVHYGVRLEYAQGCNPAVDVVPFWTPRLPGEGRDDLSQLSREEFTEAITGDGGEVFADTDRYVAHLAHVVFGTEASGLKRLARRIRKIRNPGLLAGLNPREAENELREVLPTVSPDVLRVCEDALAATEDTRLRYARAEKTTRLVEDLAAAWTQECVRHLRQSSEAARKALKRLEQAAAEERAAEESARIDGEERERLSEAVSGLDEAVEITRSRAETLARSAAASDVTHARVAAQAAEHRHASDCNALLLSGQMARERTEALLRLASAAAAQTDFIERECGGAGVPLSLQVPVTVTRRPQDAVLRVGRTVTQAVPQVEVSTDALSAERSAASLSEAAEHMRQRGNQAQLLLQAYRDVADPEERARRAREKAEWAAQAAEKAGARRAESEERLQEHVFALACRIETWADSCRAEIAAPDLRLADVAAAAREWRQGGECGRVVFEAEEVAQRVSSKASEAGSRARTRAKHHRKETGRALKAAQDAARRAQEWRSGRLLPFPRPAWSPKGTGEENAFAAAVDWNTGGPTGHLRDVLEAVLGAAGLLGAVLTAEGVEGADGWQVQARGPVLPLEQSLARVLSPVPGHGQAEVAAQVLRRIALVPDAGLRDAVQAVLVIGTDGSYRCGPLLGRLPETTVHRPPLASHIGIQARRAAVLREAAAAQDESDQWSHTAARHEHAAQLLDHFGQQTKMLAGSFPQQLVGKASAAEAVRADHARAAAAAHDEAAAEDRLACEREAEHRAALDQWRRQAAAFELPDERDLVEEEAQSLRLRRAAMAQAAERVRALGATLPEIDQACDSVREALTGLRDAHTTAERSHGDLLSAQTALEVCRERSSLDDLNVEQQAEEAAQQLSLLSGQLAARRGEYTRAVEAAAAAESRRGHAIKDLRTAEQSAEDMVTHVAELADVPGLREALAWHADAKDLSGAWLASLQDALAQVPQTPASASLEECADNLRAHLREEPDDGWRLGRGPVPEPMPGHQLLLAGKRLPPPTAAAQAAARRDQALGAYNAADAQALDRFVLGRIPAAISTAWVELQDWVKDVNAQMSLASASSGVGVQISVRVRDDLSPAVRTIYELTCKVSDADRTPEQQQQIGQALQAVLRMGGHDTADEHRRDTERGRRLRDAINVRDWVEIKYMVTRGDQRQEKWGGNGVTVSQGESRLIVLAPMLAALAAAYRPLPAHAAKLAALDEVPGEIDEKGRDGIAAYVASLDLDLICTSHNWDGSPGAWDGIDIYDLEKTADGTVVTFEEMRLYDHLLLEATGNALPAQNHHTGQVEA